MQIHNGKKGKTDNVHILLQEVDYLGIFGTSAEQQIFFSSFLKKESAYCKNVETSELPVLE